MAYVLFIYLLYSYVIICTNEFIIIFPENGVVRLCKASVYNGLILIENVKEYGEIGRGTGGGGMEVLLFNNIAYTFYFWVDVCLQNCKQTNKIAYLNQELEVKILKYIVLTTWSRVNLLYKCNDK